MPEDIDVSGDEVVKALKAMKGFEEVLLAHSGGAKGGSGSIS
jgi:hypothetical protein